MRAVVWVGALAVLACGKSSIGPPIAWTDDIDVAETRARQEGKPMLIFVNASYDVASRKLDTVTFQDPALRAKVFEDFVPLRIDTSNDDDANTRRVLERYAVHGIPTVILSWPASRAQLVRFEEYLPPSELLAALNDPRFTVWRR